MFYDIDKLFDEKTEDTTFRQDQLRKGENLLKTQSESLYYASDFGIDIAYFLESAIRFQNTALQSYIIERLTANYLIVSEFQSLIDEFFLALNIKISTGSN